MLNQHILPVIQIFGNNKHYILLKQTRVCYRVYHTSNAFIFIYLLFLYKRGIHKGR